MAFDIEKIDIIPYYFENDGVIPNNKLPLLIYKNVIPFLLVENVEMSFQNNGWTNNWKDIILPYDHFHSNTHEVLGLIKGQARLMAGGSKAGQEVVVETGDVIIIPAGVGHYSLDNSIDYQFIGGYPNGADWNLYRSWKENDHTSILDEIDAIPLPKSDPIFGLEGPLFDYWK